MTYPTVRGRFIWHELITNEPDAAIAFYQKVIGWKIEGWDQNPSYKMWMGKRGPVGGMMAPTEVEKAMGARPIWLAYIGTPDIEGTVRDAVRLGGRVVKEITAVPGVGQFALLTDPQGGIFATLQQTRPMPPYEDARPGEFAWHELVTTDPEAGFRFYHDLFGWEKTDGMDMGPMGIYQMFGWTGLNLGGVYRKPPDLPGPPHWLGYVEVADCKRTTAVIEKNGGKVLHGPVQVPGGGWITMALDPEIVAFAIHSMEAPKKPARPPAAQKAKKKAKSTRGGRTRRPKPARRRKPVSRAKKGKRGRGKGRK